MYCVECGNELEKEDLFCPMCGTRAEADEPKPARASRRHAWLVAPVLAVVLILASAPLLFREPRAGTVRTFGPDRMEFVYVPAGEFWMGSRLEDPTGPPDTQPGHRVRLDGYWIGKHEVTRAQWSRFLRESGYQWGAYTSAGHPDNLPAGNITWNDAMAYCRWAGHRLPTEAEWEKAARGTDKRPFPWGAMPDLDGTRFRRPVRVLADALCPVGSHPSGASPYGCMDMIGNAVEWCADWYDRDYYKRSPSENPPGPATGQERVERSYWWSCIGRYGDNPSRRDPSRGFRVARDFRRWEWANLRWPF